MRGKNIFKPLPARYVANNGNKGGKLRKFFIILFLIFLFSGIGFAKDRALYLYETETENGDLLCGYQDARGRTVIKPQYSHAYTEKFEYLAFVVKDGRPAAVNRKGAIVLEPFIFDNGPDYLSEGLFRFVSKGKTGFADEKGKIVIKARYDFATPFSGGIARYSLGGRPERVLPGGQYSIWTGGYENGFINKKGDKFKEAGELRDGQRRMLTFDGKEVFLDGQGKKIKKKRNI